ncbi:unnamed protein product [Cyclocybe aegerita]|uniref:Uncharacterized protein n=1 Tax=Cyclocybe aegerita TaxID=1973307 RepID=A0A8S0WCD0_CYCAE|nr:unnamed protein product [Cyclocybe aegerita]
MDDFPVDGDLDSLPISPNASVLEALYDLGPPSPVLTPSQLAFTWSSGDIPVVLYDDAYRDEFSSSQILGTNEGKRNSSSTLRANRLSAHSKASRRSSATHSRASVVLGSLDSSDTIVSAGTFGPKRRSLQPLDGPQAVRIFPEGIASNFRSSVTHSKTSNRESFLLGNSGPTSIQDNPTPVEPLTEDSSRDTRHLSFGHVKSDSSGDENVGGDETPRKSRESTSWISSRDWDNQQYKDFVARTESSTRSQTRYSFTISQVRSDMASQPQVSPTRRRVSENHVASREMHRTHISGEIQEHCRDKSASTHKTGQPLTQPKLHRAEDHSWLRGLAVSFLVDQEGFRAAQPSFKFSGIARLRSSPEVKLPDTLMAQFRPISRQSFHFHHAPFESPPILRRVTLNDDETHDYVSKQAHLTLKSNGVYVVYGHELFASDHASEPVKLHWQFEYFVDNRRVDASNSKRDMEGEKMLTPLTFSCSPNLLLPVQAKRINIMHVFKKGVGPKLVAEKMLPPGVARAPAHPAPATGLGILVSSQTEAHLPNFLSSKSVWNLHKRGQSNVVKQGDLHGNRHHRVDTSPDSKPYSKHRRASSVGEHLHSRSIASRLSDHIMPRHRRDSSHGAAVVHGPPTNRHIIPPAQLVHMLDVSSKENLPPAPPPPKFERHSSEFIPLTPRPRHAHQLSRGR